MPSASCLAAINAHAAPYCCSKEMSSTCSITRLRFAGGACCSSSGCAAGCETRASSKASPDPVRSRNPSFARSGEEPAEEAGEGADSSSSEEEDSGSQCKLDLPKRRDVPPFCAPPLACFVASLGLDLCAAAGASDSSGSALRFCGTVVLVV